MARDMTDGGPPAATGDRIGLGIGLTVLAVLIFGIQDAVAKILVQDYAVPQIVMMRYWAFAAFSLALVAWQSGLVRAFHSRKPGLQIARGLLLVTDILLFATAVRTMPLGELIAIVLLFPVLVTLFSIPMLGEVVGRVRMISVVVAFVGALIMLRPGFTQFDIGAVYGLGAAVAFALYTILTRMVARHDGVGTSMFYVGGVGLVVSNIFGMFYWQPLTPGAWGLVAILWVTTTVGHFLVIRSLTYAPASVVQPFNYLMLPWAITLSFVLFGHLIDFWSLVGAIIIVGAGLMVWVRERKKTTDT
ncbi:MAG: DMT family transporter [Alphaproteobacteria bacterium]|nr:DMT family transporter [Alphaproteobacteria bacterium]